MVEDSIEKYRELYFLIDTGTWIEPLSTARMLRIGDAQVLETIDPFAFNAGGCTDGYWSLEASGPALIDFSAVQKQIQKVIPPDAVALEVRCDGLAMDKLLVSSPVLKKNASSSRDSLGKVEVHFKLDGDRAIPVSSSFMPEEAQ